MSEMSNYLEERLLEHAFELNSWTNPSSLYVALFVSPSTNDLETSNFTDEVDSTTNYQRQSVSFSGTGNSVDNDSTIQFPEADTSWGTVDAVAVTDSSSHGSGNILMYDEGVSNISIGDNDIYEIGASDLTITFD